jgi:hypothetical protein
MVLEPGSCRKPRTETSLICTMVHEPFAHCRLHMLKLVSNSLSVADTPCFEVAGQEPGERRLRGAAEIGPNGAGCAERRDGRCRRNHSSNVLPQLFRRLRLSCCVCYAAERSFVGMLHVEVIMPTDHNTLTAPRPHFRFPHQPN